MKLHYVSWADNTGYAIAAKSYLTALAGSGIELRWTPMLPNDSGYAVVENYRAGNPALAALATSSLEADTILVHTVPEYYDRWIEVARAAGKRVFGYTVWELERLPTHWPAILNRLDGVIVPCRWNAETFAASGVTVPIHVVPHLPQFPASKANSPAPPSALEAGGAEAFSAERFLFYTVGFWSNRKAPDLVVRAFLEAFTRADDVALLVKTSNKDITRLHRSWRQGFRRRHPSPKATLHRLLRGRGATPQVSVIADEQLADAEMLALHRRGDCYVSLARSEGWGMGAFDAAMLGNPVIMTGYGGQLDFLDRRYAHLVEHTMAPVHEPTWSANYRPSDLWAEPDIAHAAGLMRKVYENREWARNRAETLAANLARDYSEAAILAAWRTALD